MKGKMELEPCPFCGASASAIYWYPGPQKPRKRSAKFEMRCDGEGCHASLGYTFETEEKGIAAWNRRASIAAKEG